MGRVDTQAVEQIPRYSEAASSSVNPPILPMNPFYSEAARRAMGPWSCLSRTSW